VTIGIRPEISDISIKLIGSIQMDTQIIGAHGYMVSATLL